MKINKKMLATAAVTLAVPICAGLAACQPSDKPHTHEYVHHAEIPATCAEHGVAEYWSCSGCDMLFADGNGENVITAPDAIEKTDHVMTDFGYDENGHWRVCKWCHDETGEVVEHDKYLIVESPLKNTYLENETFVSDGMRVFVVCDCGIEQDVTADAVVENANVPLALDQTSLPVSYGDMRSIVSVTVLESRIVKIDVKLKPNVAYYNNGKALPAASDFTVTATYNHGAQTVLAEDKYTVTAASGFSSKGGKITVSVSNNLTFEMTYELIAVAMDSIEIKVNPSNTVFRTDETVTLDGMVLAVIYNDGSKKEITEGYTCAEAGQIFDTEGVVNAMVSYTENGVTKTVLLPITISNDDGDIVSVKFADDAVYSVYAGEAFPQADLTLYAVYESNRALPLAVREYSFKLPEGTAKLGGKYVLEATLADGSGLKATLPVAVVKKIEGENYTKIVGGTVKTETEYVQNSDGTITQKGPVSFVGDFAKAAIAGADSYVEWTVDSETFCSTDVTFRAGNSNIRSAGKEGDKNKYIMEALRVNTIADLYVNGVKITLGDDIVLAGCGPSIGTYVPIYNIYNAFTVSGVKLNPGTNIIRLAFKDSSIGEKNYWNESPSTMNIDAVEFAAYGSADAPSSEVTALAFYYNDIKYGDYVQPALSGLKVIGTMADGSNVIVDPSLYDIAVAQGEVSKGYFGFGSHKIVATLKSDNSKTCEINLEFAEVRRVAPCAAEVAAQDGKAYYVLTFECIGYEYTAADFKIFDGSTVLTAAKSEQTPTKIKLYLDVTGLAKGNFYPHAEIGGKKYDGCGDTGNTAGDVKNYAAGNVNIVMSSAKITVGGKTYSIVKQYDMPRLTVE